MVVAQNSLDAYVKTIDSDLAGVASIYRFTVQVQDEFSIQTYLPTELQPSEGSPAICRLYLISTTEDIQNCYYSAEFNLIQFNIDTGFSGYIVYDIGYLINPPYSVVLSGFIINTLDSTGTIVASSDPYQVFAQINPNIISGQSLSVGSLQIAAQTTYLFKFIITNPVQQGGQIQILFPSTQIAVPQTAPTTTISVDSGQTWSRIFVSSITSTSLTFSITTLLPASSSIQLQMLQINNPNTMVQTNSFQIKTKTPSSQVIDVVSTGLTVICNLPAVITIESVSFSRRVVGQTQTLTFKVTLPTVYSSGGYLLAYLPSTLSINQSLFNCILLIGFNDDSGFCRIQNVTRIMLFDQINQQQLVFAIQGIINPPNTKQTDNFKFEAYDPANNLIALSNSLPNFGFTPITGSITQVSSTRSRTTVGAATNVTIVFTTQNILQTGQIIDILIPLTQLQLPTTLTCLTRTQYDQDLVNNTCSLTSTASSFTISFSVNCQSNQGTCAASTQHTVLIQNLTNLQFIATSITDSIRITSMTSDRLFLVDTVQSGIFTLPALTEGTFTNVTLNKTVGVVGDNTSFSLNLTTQNQIGVGGRLVIIFVDQTFQKPVQNLVCLSQQVQATCSFQQFSSGYVSQISIDSPCGAQNSCTAKSTLQIEISGIRNPKSVFPIVDQFTIRSYTSLNQAIDLIVFSQATGLEITPATLVSVQLRQPVSPSVIKTGAITNYVISVIPKNGVDPINGKLEVTFPNETKFVSNTTCTAYAEISLQQLTCQVTKATNKLVVTHSLTGVNFSGLSIIVTAINIVNPPTTALSGYGQVITYLSTSGTFYQVDLNLVAFQVQPNTPNQLINVNATRSAFIVNQATTLMICYTPFNPIPASSIILINIPQEQLILGQSVTTQDLIVFQQSGQTIYLQTQAKVNQGQQSCFTLAGSIRNPSTTILSTSSITVQISTSDGFQIDEQTQNIFAMPLLSAGPFNSLNILSTNNTIGQKTSLVFTVNLAADLASGSTFLIQLPASTFYISQDLNCQIQQQAAVACQLIDTTTDILGSYYKQMQIPISQSFSSGSNVQFTINSLVNKFNTAAQSSLITVLSQDVQGSTINYSQFKLEQTYLPNTSGYFTLSRSPLQIQVPTKISLSVQLQTRVIAGSQMVINLPSFWFTNPFNIQLQLNQTPVGLVQTQTTNYQLIAFNLPQCNDLSTFSIQISGFQNRYSTDSSTDYVSLKTVTQDGFVIDSIGATPFSDMLIPGSVTIQQANIGLAIIGQQTTLTLQFKADGSSIAGDSISVLNDNNSLYQMDSQTIKLNGNNVGFSELPTINGFWRGFTINLSSALTNSFTVTVAGVQNLNRVEPLNFSFNVLMATNSGGVTFTGTTNLQGLNILAPTAFDSISLIRNSNIITTATGLNINFTISQVDILPNSQLTILIPSQELLMSGTCKVAQPYSCVTSTQNQSFTSLLVSNVCQSGCQKGQQVVIQISNGFTNPQEALYSTLSSQITLQNNNYLIATINSGVVVLPKLQTANINLKNLAVSQVGNVAGAQVQVQMQFQIDSDQIQVAQIILQIPPNTFIFNTSNPPICSISTFTQLSCIATSLSKLAQGQPQFVQELTLKLQQNTITSTKLTRITIKNLINSDIPSDRSLPVSLSLNLISQSNLILFSTLVQLQDQLLIPQIELPTFTRASTKSGQTQVLYQLQFTAPTYIRSDSYFILNLPLEQGVIQPRQITCRQQTNGRAINCKQLTSDDLNYQVVRLTQWCNDITKSTLCQPNQVFSMTMLLSNPSQIQSYGFNATVEIYTADDELVAQSTGFFVSPQLAGLLMNNPTIKRNGNILAQTNETLTIVISSISSSVLTSTDLIVSLPEGFAFSEDNQTFCYRQFNGQNLIQCQITQIYTQSVKQITLYNFCNQNYICISDQQISFTIGNLKNPTTNSVQNQQTFVISLEQSGNEIGFVSFNQQMPLLKPSQSDLTITMGRTCQTLGTCQIIVTLPLQNQFKTGNYVVFTSKLDFLSQQCTATNVNVTCSIDQTRSLRLIASGDVSTMSLQFRVQAVMMPATSQSILNFSATSFEIVQNRAVPLQNFIGGNVTVPASAFQNFQVQRANSNLSATTDLKVSIKTRQNAQGDFIQIYIPTQQAVLQSSVQCLANGQQISCDKLDNQTINIPLFNKWCLNPAQGCQFTIQNVQNPSSLVYQSDQQARIILYQGNIQTLYYESQKSFVLVTPSLLPKQLQVYNATYDPSYIQSGQDIQFSFNFNYDASVSQQFMFVQFVQDKNQFVPIVQNLYQVQVFCNAKPTELIDLQSALVLKNLTFKLPTVLLDGQNTISITGLNAPNIWRPGYSDSLVQIKLMQTSVVELASTQVNVDFIFTAAQINPLTAYQFTPYPGQIAYIYISFMFQPKTIRGSFTNIVVPPEFTLLQNQTCSDMYSGQIITCSINKSTIQIDKSIYQGTTPYNGFQFKLGPVKNPIREQVSNFTISEVDPTGLIYATGQFQLITANQSKDCTDQNCESCTKSYCVICKAGYILNGQSCVKVCPTNMFQIDQRCYKCSQNCLQCQKQDQCSICNSDEVMLGGMCLNQCPKLYILNTETQTCDFKNQKIIDCNGKDRQNYFLNNTQNDQEQICQPYTPLPCFDNLCLSCSLIPGFCEKCKFGSKLINGKCVNYCPSGYFEYKSQCYKCNPLCKECNLNANICTSCQRGLMLTDGYQTCVTKCPTGTYINIDDPNRCTACDDTCNSCQNTSTQCTSCYRNFKTEVDLYYNQEGQCVETCPVGTITDYLLHQCVQSDQSVLNWSLPLCAVGLLFVFIITKLSRCFGQGKDRQFWVASALINLIDFVNRVVLLCLLWPTVEMTGFVFIGVYIMGTQLVGIYESKIVMIQGRINTISILTQLTGPYTTRLMLGNPFAQFVTVTNQRALPWDQFERCCSIQTVLTVMYTVCCCVMITRFGVSQATFGIAVNGIIFGAVQITLQLLIKKCERKLPSVAKIYQD